MRMRKRRAVCAEVAAAAVATAVKDTATAALAE